MRDEFGNKMQSDANFSAYSDKKILGVKWRPETDEFYFSVDPLSDVVFTKRGLLSKLAALFDLLGLAAAVTVKGKFACQN